jgi:hypothetical protein
LKLYPPKYESEALPLEPTRKRVTANLTTVIMYTIITTTPFKTGAKFACEVLRVTTSMLRRTKYHALSYPSGYMTATICPYNISYRLYKNTNFIV